MTYEVGTDRQDGGPDVVYWPVVPGEHSEVPLVSSSLGADALAQAEERYASLFTHHPHATYSVDCRGFYTDANQRALEMTGLSLEEMRRTHFADVIHPDDVHLLQAGFDRALAGVPQVVEARVQRVDGAIVDIRCTAIPVLVDGEVVGVHGITEDTTEEQRVLRDLRSANAAKTRFLATVSHEVRTPLAALIGAADLLMETDLDDEPAHYAQVVHRNAERLMRLARDLLDFSQLEASRTVLEQGPLHVRELVEEVEAWAAPLAEARGIELVVEVDANVPTTGCGDGPRIAQVLRTLVHNAIKFTEHGRVDVRASCAGAGAGDTATTWLCLEVADTGIGIDDEQLPVLFEPFTQADPHASGDRQGNGLGLAIASELADLMHGRLEVESTIGTGSRFTFGVPVGLAPDEGSVR
jgi:PAS domain S-box-containing protein